MKEFANLASLINRDIAMYNEKENDALKYF